MATYLWLIIDKILRFNKKINKISLNIGAYFFSYLSNLFPFILIFL